MAYPEYVRDKARQLRVERNLTIDELAERLAVPRTTVYGWVRDLPIGQTAKRTLAARRAGEVTREIHRRRRAAAYALGKGIWIRRLAANPVVYSFQHHADQDPDELRAFWGRGRRSSAHRDPPS